MVDRRYLKSKRKYQNWRGLVFLRESCTVLVCFCESCTVYPGSRDGNGTLGHFVVENIWNNYTFRIARLATSAPFVYHFQGLQFPFRPREIHLLFLHQLAGQNEFLCANATVLLSSPDEFLHATRTASYGTSVRGRNGWHIEGSLAYPVAQVGGRLSCLKLCYADHCRALR